MTPCRVVLEVERKFRGLAVPVLAQHAGRPPFRRLQALPAAVLHDAYYDRADGALAAAGAWVRRRNGAWQAKVRRGGDWRNSRFEELQGAAAVGGCVHALAGGASTTNLLGSDPDRPFGLLPLAAFVTHRQAWRADDGVTIVVDATDFGHTVGEVELEETVVLAGTAAEEDEARKMEVMAAMDARIAAFLATYAWAFLPGEPKGKLTAYFETVGRGVVRA